MEKREIKMKTAAIMGIMRKPIITCSGIYILLNFLMSFFVTKLFGFDKFLNDFYTQYMAGNTEFVPEIPTVAPAAQIIVLLIGIVLIVVSTGFTGTFLKASRGEEFNVRDLLDGFEFFFKALLLHVIRALIIAAGCALCLAAGSFLLAGAPFPVALAACFALALVPGLFLFYRYSLAVFVLYDNPDRGVFWCLRESNRLVTGHKKQLFSLHVSFIPLLLLCEVVAMLLAPIADIWAKPFIGIACAVFYNELLPHEEPAEVISEQAE